MNRNLRTYSYVETWQISKCLLFLWAGVMYVYQIPSWIHHEQSDREELCSCSFQVIWSDWCAAGVRRMLQIVFLSSGSIGCLFLQNETPLWFGWWMWADNINTEGYWGNDFWKALLLKMNVPQTRSKKSEGQRVYLCPSLFGLVFCLTLLKGSTVLVCSSPKSSAWHSRSQMLWTWYLQHHSPSVLPSCFIFISYYLMWNNPCLCHTISHLYVFLMLFPFSTMGSPNKAIFKIHPGYHFPYELGVLG